jgi:RNA polymerase sigma-70 factor (subfamily 1)
MSSEPKSTSEPDLHELLMQRADKLSCYVAGRIRKRFQGLILVEDVLQEIWISAFRTFAGFRPHGPGSFDRWLTAIAQRRLADLLRRLNSVKRGGAECILQGHAANGSSFVDLFHRLASPGKTPSREIAAQEAARAVQIALGGLAEPRRRAIYMRYIEGRSRQEIARAMDKSDAAVSSLLYQGLRELRERLGHACRFFSDAASDCGNTTSSPRNRTFRA